jgi:DnaJ-class molecular chaperone
MKRIIDMETDPNDIYDVGDKVDCDTCKGEGEIYEDTSHQCSVVISNCCGGCGYYEPCEDCEGTGMVESD